MRKISLSWIPILLVALLATACGTSTGSQPLDPNQPAIRRDAAESYSALFLLQFDGAKSWTYQLKIRKTAALREINLHIEGIEKSQNPGDIRLLTDAATTWTIGPGTDQQCVQFPSGKGMDPTFIYPESLVSLPALGGALKRVGEAQLEGRPVLHFRATGASSGPWRDITLDLVQEQSSGMLRQFTLSASGEDPFFAAGSGKLKASYTAGPLGDAAITPVAGCEISVPLPQGASMFVRLPGLASFESQSSVDELVKYYQSALPGQQWLEKDPPTQAQGVTALSYQRGAESVQIQIETKPEGGSKVKLLFNQGQ